MRVNISQAKNDYLAYSMRQLKVKL